MGHPVAAHATVCTVLPFSRLHQHQLATLATLAAWARTGPAWDQPGPAAADIAIYIFVTGQHSLDTRVLLFWHQEKSPSQLTPSPCREHLLSHSVHSTVFIDWLFLLSSTFSEYCLFRLYRCQNGRTLLETRAQQHSPHRAANAAFIAITIQHIAMHCAGWVAAGARRSRVIPCNPTSQCPAVIINCSHQHTCYAECIEAQLQMVTPQPQHCSSQVQVQWGVWLPSPAHIFLHTNYLGSAQNRKYRIET